MSSIFDVLGVVFGVLSLLGCVKSIYRFIKARQPHAEAEFFEEALRDANQRIDELERHGYLSENPALSIVYRSALARMDSGSLRLRADAERRRPKSAVAVLVYSWRYGVHSEPSRRISTLTKQVQSIRHQLDYPVEQPDIDYSLARVALRLPEHEPVMVHKTYPDASSNTDARSAATGAQTHQTIEGIKQRNINPPIDVDIMSQIHDIRTRKLRRIRQELENIAEFIVTGTDSVYGFSSNIVKLNQQLLLERGMLPTEDLVVDMNQPDSVASEEPHNFVGLIYEMIKRFTPTTIGQERREEARAETLQKIAQRKAALEINVIKKAFESLLFHEFLDRETRGSHIITKIRNKRRRT